MDQELLMTLASGIRLGPYEVIAPLGGGGMGEVYKARDTRLNREVAIKVLSASFSRDPDRLRRFENEAKAAGSLNHPNITAVYDVGEHEGAPYVVEELLEGETLRGELAGARLSTRRAIEIAVQIAHGLSAAHEKGIVHRDLKPENVFITTDGRVKILDFGLAKLIQREAPSDSGTSAPTEALGTEPGIVMGTVGYMSPEQIRGRPADARSDIFAFGAVLYEMLSGRRAFSGDSAADTMSAILREEPPDLSATNPAVSPGLERIIHHCLEKSPERRFHSAHDLAFDLEALSTLSGASTAEKPGPRPNARSVRVIIAVAAALALLTAGVLVGRKWTPVARAGASSDSMIRKRLTFRRGHVLLARLTADGQDVVYSASWDGRPAEVFFTHVGSPESRSLGIEGASLLSVSSSGELAILLKKSGLSFASGRGTLARVPMAGGAPRSVAEDVTAADWMADGGNLAAVRDLGSRQVVEFPLGKVVYSAASLLTSIRVSPDGKRAAFIESDGVSNWIDVVDGGGKKTTLAKGFIGIFGLAWGPAGQEIWFSGVDRSPSFGIFAVDLRGSQRTVAHTMDFELIQDIARDGNVLTDREIERQEILGAFAGDRHERNLSWLEESNVGDLSADGKTLLFSESGEGGGLNGSVYERSTDGGPAIRLGDGRGCSLSPDGKWALTIVSSSNGPRIVLLPTGAGEPRPVPVAGLDEVIWAGFRQDGKQILIVGSEPGQGVSGYVVDAGGGRPRRFAPDLSMGGAESPDGQFYAYTRADRRPVITPFAGGEPRVIAGLDRGDVPIQWSADGQYLFLTHYGDAPQPIYRLNLKSGKKETWRELMPADRTGFVRINDVVMTPDGLSYAYDFSSVASDLFLVKGWR